MIKIIQNITLLCIILLLTSCENDEFIIHGTTMGTTYTVKSDKFIDKKIIDKELSAINKIFSNWDKNSEVEKINHSPINTTIPISLEFKKLLLTAQQIHQKTNNYFDISIGNLIDIWGFGVQKTTKKPNQKQIFTALNNSGVSAFKIHNNNIIKSKNIKFNFSAIAKGYGVDRVIAILKQHNINSGLVEIGGEVRTIGIKNIGIERLQKPPFKIILNNEAIATSGDYRNYKIWNSQKFIHILNPKTGYPSNSNLISVSIIHKNTAIADGFATAILAMGKDRALVIIDKYQLKSILINDKNKIYTFNL